MNGRQCDEQAESRADFLARLEYGLNPAVTLNGAHQESGLMVRNPTRMGYSGGTNEDGLPAGASTPGARRGLTTTKPWEA